jgi:thymidylate synthase
MKSYKDIVINVLENGTKKSNRTGVDTISVTGTQLRHDMRTGFPLITLKKTPFKLICVELEGFIKGITDKKWYEDNGCTIWSEWANPLIAPYGHDEESKRIMKETRDLGPIYGYQLRNFNKPYKPVPQIITPFDKGYDNTLELKKHPIYGEYVILDSYSISSKARTKRYDIQFIKTGFRIYGLIESKLLNNIFIDPYFPSVAEVGCLGNREYIRSIKNWKKLRKIWNNIIDRCYNKDSSDYNNYGAKDIYVSQSWLIFSNFLKDVQDLENWDKKLNNWTEYSLDKDKYSKNSDKHYSKETCHWADLSTQCLYNSQFKEIKAINLITKEEIILENMKYDCKKYGFTPSSVLRVINGQRKTHKGYIFERIENKEIYFDQLKNIVDTLKTNPTCRRMVASYWNENQSNMQSLKPCHYNWQVLSDGKNIDLIFNMRSVDVGLGMPFDIAHYGMMLKLLALEAGMTPRWLVGNFADTHIYENHIEGMQELISRDPLPLPTVKIPDFKSIFDWSYTQRKLENYQTHDKIDLKIAI